MHPIVDALELSPQQLDAIAGLGGDALITAGAGTGKTRTLTARFLQLLAGGAPLRSIVAITFTRKAAREMRNRIRQHIWAYLARADLDEKERQQWHRIAIAMDAARISTIHSLCREILQTHPAEAKVDPHFQTLDEGKMLLLQSEVVTRTLMVVADHPHLAGLIGEIGEKMVKRAVMQVLQAGAEGESVLAGLKDDSQAQLSEWEHWLLARQRQRLQTLMQTPAWQEARDYLAAAAPLSEKDKLALQRAHALKALDLLNPSNEGGQFRQGVALLQQINLSGGSQKNWPGGKEQVAEIRAAIKVLRAPFGSSRQPGPDAWLGQTLNEFDARSADALLKLKSIALLAFKIYRKAKKEQQVLDYDDLETLALRLLEENAHVRAYWRQQVQALLVDEFQDTNARQSYLLMLLDGNRGKRFLVGDAKQSIYRFRGADVEVFRSIGAKFAKSGARVTALDETYRAEEPLVHALNTLLKSTLGAGKHPWEAPFSPLVPARRSSLGCQGPVSVELQLSRGSRRDGALKQAAQAAVVRLQEVFAAGKCTPGDVAILTRASSSFSAYEDALDAAGIPFLTLAGRGFYQRPEIRDLLNVLRAAADPTDDLALVGALRSPGLGLSDISLFLLAQQRDAWRHLNASSGETPHPVTLWRSLASPPDGMDAEEMARARRAYDLLATLHDMVGRVPAADLLKQYIDEVNYLAILASSGQNRAMRNVMKLLDDIQRSGIVQVFEVNDYVQSVRDVGVREGEAAVVAEGVVQIMTVHRAKGLEFPVVVLGDVTYEHTSAPDLLFTDKQISWKLTDPMNPKKRPVLYEALLQEERLKEEAEQKRLFYVAATRAKSFLLMNGVLGRQIRGWLTWVMDVLPELPEALEDDAILSTDCELSDGSVVRCSQIGKTWKPTGGMFSSGDSVSGEPPFLPDLIAPRAIEEDILDDKQKAVERKPEQRIWRVSAMEGKRAWAPSWIVGKLIHRAIEGERFPDDPKFNAWLMSSARSMGLSDEALIRNALVRARRVLTNLKESPLWKTVLAAEERFHELPYTYQTASGRIDRGTIDLVYHTGDHWVIVDFKTDRIRDDSELADRIAKMGYARQVKRYQAAMQTLVGRDAEIILCFLDVHGGVETVTVEGE